MRRARRGSAGSAAACRTSGSPTGCSRAAARCSTHELPDVSAALVAAGAVRINPLDRMPPTIADRAPRPGDERFGTLHVRRPVLEQVVGGGGRAGARPHRPPRRRRRRAQDPAAAARHRRAHRRRGGAHRRPRRRRDGPRLAAAADARRAGHRAGRRGAGAEPVRRTTRATTAARSPSCARRG